ncbi:MAG: DUF4864 domain-containing protein [Devosiaceae bacterium]
MMQQSHNRVHHQSSRQSKAIAASMAEQAARVQRLVLLGLVAFAAFAFVMATAVQASEPAPVEVPTATVEKMEAVITAQIDAFLADDADAAYAFAAERIKMQFPTAGMFVSMVQRGYPAVYAPQSFSFASAALTPDGPALQVEFVGEDGQVWRGLYTFVEEGAGELLISGVFLRRQNERQI